MNLNVNQPHSAIRSPLRWLLPATILVLGCLAREANAQQALAPSMQYSTTPPAMQLLEQQNQMQVFAPPGIVPIPESPGFAAGPVVLRPHAFYRFLYGDGIPTAGSNHVTTTIQEISPGIMFGFGNHWTLDYTPTWRYYSSGAFNDSLDHYVRLTGGGAINNWILGLSQSYAMSSTPLVETGVQTDQQTFLTALRAACQLNSKISLDLSVNQSILSADQFTGQNEWYTLDWLNYQFYPRLEAGVGVGFGYVNMSAGSDMTYEQLQGRVGWRPTDKLSFQVHGGAEIRQFLSGGDTIVNPIMGAVIQYQPFEVTRLTFAADNTVSSSYFQSTASESTSVVVGVNQRLLKVLYLDVAGGYHRTQYIASNATTGRTDEYYTFNVSLSTAFLKQRGTAAVFYQFSDDRSTQPGFTYTSNQVGFELGYRY